MEINRKNLSGPIKWLGFALLLLFSGCVPRDVDGHLPEQVVVAFVEAINARDFSRAQSFWEPVSILNAEKNYEKPFADFCVTKFSCESFTAEPQHIEGRVFFVGFIGTRKNQEPATFMFELEKHNGRWLIVMDQFMPSKPIAPKTDEPTGSFSRSQGPQ